MVDRPLFRNHGRRASDAPLVPPVVVARELDIERALAFDTVDLRFQPIFNLDTGQIVGAEALARIDGFAGTEVLFERARKAGLAERLSRHIQRKALGIAGQWEEALANVRLSINLLPEDLERDGFEHWLIAQIAAAGVDPARVTIEITENAFIADLVPVGERLHRLRDSGIAVALDDFGSGYASMANLAALPLDILKIDRTLIERIEYSERHQAVVRGVLAIARELGLRTVVEGVESAGQLSLLSDWGCDLYQGFIGSAALTERSLARFVAAQPGA